MAGYDESRGGAMYGSTESGAESKRGGASSHLQSIAFMATPPFIMYAAMDVTFAFLAGPYMPIALVLAAICIAFGVLFFQLGQKNAKRPMPIYTFLSVLCFLATASGILSGISIHTRFFGPYFMYKHRPVYTDVLATDPAAARADAGIINFADNAIVDTMRSGLMVSSRGKSFCVAPILDESQQLRAEYWAVGLDCCEGRVSFHCDDAQDLAAKTGVVVIDYDEWQFNDLYNKFQQAVRQASARNVLQLPKNPVLVRWVKDAQTVTDGLWRDGSISIGIGIVISAFVSVIIAVALHGAMGRKR